MLLPVLKQVGLQREALFTYSVSLRQTTRAAPNLFFHIIFKFQVKMGALMEPD